MSWTGSRISRLFPFSAWGCALLGVAAGVLALGAIRMELAALVWGSSFVLLALYCLAGSHLTRKVLQRHIQRTLEPVDFRLPVAGLYPGAHGTAEIASELPRRTIPGFQIWFSASLQWRSRPALRVSALLPPGRLRRSVAFRVPARGLYRGRIIRLLVRDVLGFTRAELAVPLAEQLRVFPAVRAAELEIPAGSGGEELALRLKRRPSDELLEVRKYYPGDDLRRVHWKLFAHVQELFLRVGEETPPPESRLLVILDLSTSPWAAFPQGPDLLDGMIEACASGVLALLARGLQAQVAITDRRRPVAVSLEKAEALLGLCSELWWGERFLVELPRSGRREVLLYSLPGSERQPQLLRTCATRRWKVNVFLKELRPQPASARAVLRRLVFREPRPFAGRDEDEAAAGEARLSRRDRRGRRGWRAPGARDLREPYERALAETEARLRRMSNVHVERV